MHAFSDHLDWLIKSRSESNEKWIQYLGGSKSSTFHQHMTEAEIAELTSIT